MKPNRSAQISLLIVGLVICGGLLLSGCASLGKGKKAGSGTESVRQTGERSERSTALKETRAGSPEAEKEAAVKTQTVPEQDRTAAKVVSKPAAASKSPTAVKTTTAAKPVKTSQKTSATKPVKNASPAAPRSSSSQWMEIIPGTLKNLNWNRIVPILMGIGALSLIYGLAFWLGRLHLRRRKPSRRGPVGQTNPQPAEAAFQ